MRNKGMKLLACACVCFATTAGATLYQWTGNGNLAWDDCENWDSCGGIPGLGPWPNSTADDAIIDASEMPDDHHVYFVNHSIKIDDLTLMGGEPIHIRGPWPPDDPTLTVDVLTIQGSNNPMDGDTVVTVGGLARILTYDN